MRIALDARKIDDFGIGTYIRGLAVAAARARPDRELLLLGPERPPPEIADAAHVTAVGDTTAKYGVGELLRPPGQLLALDVDVFHVPHYILPLRLPVPTVVTIHDCIHLRFPGWLPRPLGVLPRRLSWLYARLMLRRATRAADAVIAVSGATRRDLESRLGADPHRVHVVPNGCDPLFLADPEPGEVEATLSDLRLPARYVLWVGNPKPHKNLPRLLQAWERTAETHPEAALLLVGAVEPDAMPEGRVRRLGPVSPPVLRALYHGAEALAIPSLYEGFGLPALEAMACGTPVLAAEAGGLPEVVGDAGLLVPPGSVDEILTGLVRLLDDPGLREALGARGRERARGFRWEDAAEATGRIWDRVAGGG